MKKMSDPLGGGGWLTLYVLFQDPAKWVSANYKFYKFTHSPGSPDRSLGRSGHLDLYDTVFSIAVKIYIEIILQCSLKLLAI